jgi:hypothetical protein
MRGSCFTFTRAREDVDAGGSLGSEERYGLNTPAGNLAFHERMLQLSRETFDLAPNSFKDWLNNFVVAKLDNEAMSNRCNQ